MFKDNIGQFNVISYEVKASKDVKNLKHYMLKTLFMLVCIIIHILVILILF